MTPKWTPGPWMAGEIDKNGGYDCMTAGVSCGPAHLDGARYGQARCTELSAETAATMMADARLISASPGLAEALNELLTVVLFSRTPDIPDAIFKAKAALAKAGWEG